MTRNSTSTALLVAGVALLVAPALLPVQPVLVHDTRDHTIHNASQIRAQGYEVVAYENMSERGQRLYVQALRNDGEYVVALEQGAPEFPYPTPDELGEVEDYRERTAMQVVAIERPPDADLPPPDEPVERAEHMREQFQRQNEETGRNRSVPSEAELRQRIGRYDLMRTRTAQAPLEQPASLARLGAVGLGVLALGVGGYLRSRPA